MNKQIHFIPALALGLAMLSIPTLATAETIINVVDPAPLVLKGAGARVSVEVTCDFGSGPDFDDGFIDLSVSLFQRAGSVTAQGGGFIRDTIVCDGTLQTYPILAQAFGKILRKGPAIAQVSAFFCDQVNCDSPQVTEEIQLVK